MMTANPLSESSGNNFERIETRFILKNAVLCCPICGSEAVHLGAVSVLQGCETTICKENRTVIMPSDRNQDSKGSCVMQMYYCEHWHEFLEVQEFSQGKTYRTLYARPQAVGGPDTPVVVDELWRAM